MERFLTSLRYVRNQKIKDLTSDLYLCISSARTIASRKRGEESPDSAGQPTG